MRTKSEKAICPCCKHERESTHMKRLLESEQQYNQRFPTERKMGWTLEAAKSDYLHWACDLCIKSGRAVQAHPDRQEGWGMGLPFFAYVDREYVCTDCNQPFTFSAKEQQHWYEKLKFIMWSIPRQCVECRRKRRTHNRISQELAQALKTLDERSPQALVGVALIFERAGNLEKALLYARRAKNLERDEKKRTSIGQHIERLLGSKE